MFSGVEDEETGGMIDSTPTPTWNPLMLDAFIIEKIQQERELHDSGRQPLRIEISREPMRESQEHEEKEPGDRGVANIDFTL